MRSFDQKLLYLQSMSEHLNTRMLALIALRESVNDAHRRIAYRGRRRRRRRPRERIDGNPHIPSLKKLPIPVALAQYVEERIRLTWTRRPSVLAGPIE